MTNAFIFHGTAGHSQENWFPWLKSELESKGIPTCVPDFPTPDGESLAAWSETLTQQRSKIDRSSLLVGHSKGGLFLLKVLERLDFPVECAVLVGTPIGEQPIKYYEADKAFAGFEFQWDRIRVSARRFVVFHSDNDPYVSESNGVRLAEELGTDLQLISGAGHFNQDSGYLRFPALLESIADVLPAET